MKSKDVVKFLSIDEDAIFRMGLRSWVADTENLELVAEAGDATQAWEILASESVVESLDLVVLELEEVPGAIEGSPRVPLYAQIQARYPDLPLFLLSATQEIAVLAAARAAGVRGYCRKGTPLSQVAIALREVGIGRIYWQQLPEGDSIEPTSGEIVERSPQPSMFSSMFQVWRREGLRYINADLQQLGRQLENEDLSVFDRAVLQGRRRELAVARWTVKQLLPIPPREIRVDRPPETTPNVDVPAPVSVEPTLALRSEPTEAIELQVLQSLLFDATIAKLQSNLPNLTDETLEIDIFRVEKKRELLYSILRQLQTLFADLQFSQIQPEKLSQKKSQILLDLWQETTTSFFGKYSTLSVDKKQVEIVDVLLQDSEIVRVSILDKIPLTEAFLAHLLYQVPLTIDGKPCVAGNVEAMQRAEQLLQNLLLQMANAVAQPLLNHFADVEVIKQNFYDRCLLSTREIERFRNDLSWKYRLRQYIQEPTAIYESRYVLFVLDDRGIRQRTIYAPRRHELDRLSGIQQTVTLVLEGRDALAPRLRSVTTFVGSSFVYVLTQIIGRGLGLVARGVLEGMGTARQASRSRRDRVQ
ncbi:MAG: DUF3685 domain-containing protein [Cyanobacteriota bacterium]|nr:DUF3685 domain-containing protein [Cyanobacteriota bacterium]